MSISAFECLMGAILYKYNFTKHQAPKDLNAKIDFPYNDHDTRAGFYLECAAGGLFILTSLLTVLDIMYYEKKETSSIGPMINGENRVSGRIRQSTRTKRKETNSFLKMWPKKKRKRKNNDVVAFQIRLNNNCNIRLITWSFCMQYLRFKVYVKKIAWKHHPLNWECSYVIYNSHNLRFKIISKDSRKNQIWLRPA